MEESTVDDAESPAKEGEPQAPPGRSAVSETPPDVGAPEDPTSLQDLIAVMEPLLMEIKQDVDADRTRSEAATVSLEQIGVDLAEMRSQVLALSKIVVRTEEQLQALADPPAPPRSDREHGRPWRLPVLALCASLILLSWAILVYLKTGNLMVAFGVLVVSNFAGWGAILLVRRSQGVQS